MRWMVLVVLALFAAGAAQAESHDAMDDGMNDGGDNGGNDVDIDVDNDDDTVGAGRDDGGGLSTPWVVFLVLGAVVVLGIIAVLAFAGRERYP